MTRWETGGSPIVFARRDAANARGSVLFYMHSEDDKVRGPLEGADDYVTKPFSARELLARVFVLGRRAPPRSASGDRIS